MKCLLLLLIVCVVASYGSAQRIVPNRDVLACTRHMKCGPNEVYYCCGMCFELTCDNMSRDRYCNERCYKGCYCADGYTRRWADGAACAMRNAQLVENNCKRTEHITA
ncbi:cysteine-rich venom protein 6-like [Anopheles arabiensis]|uniref:cysteine-rich venom protein 6-like n=1 Tax=Anopheles arabiensis TaxID=7173 RepID=UPI001AAD4D88|nr:cysteine-rich venom protein 6-like [Anopheles arabiensis]